MLFLIFTFFTANLGIQISKFQFTIQSKNMKDQYSIFLFIALILATATSATAAVSPVIFGCEEGAQTDGSDRQYVELDRYDFERTVLDPFLYDKTHLKTVSLLGANSHILISYSLFQEKSGSKGIIVADIVRQDGGKSTKIAAELDNGIKNIFIMENWISFQPKDSTDQNLYSVRFVASSQSFSQTQVPFATGFQTTGGTAIVPTSSWELIDLAISSPQSGVASNSALPIIIMRSPSTEVFIGQQTTVNSAIGFSGYFKSNLTNVVCAGLELCLDHDSGLVTDQSTNEIIKLASSNAKDIWGLRYADEQNDRIVSQGAVAAQFDSESKQAFLIFFDPTNNLVHFGKHIFTNDIALYMNSHVSDYVEYDDLEIRYAYLSLVPGSTTPFTHSDIIVNQVVVDAAFPILEPIITGGAIQRFAFSTSYLYMMTATGIIIVKKYIPADDSNQYVLVAAQADFPIQTQVILDSSLTDWIANPDTDVLAIVLNCPCTTKGVAHMQCFENSVCIFVVGSTFGDCSADILDYTPGQN